MSTNVSQIFEGNWDELQGKIKKQWGKFTDNDVKKFEGSYDEFVGQLKKTYGLDDAKAQAEIADFLYQQGYKQLKNKTEELWQSACEVKEKVKDSIKQSAQNIKESSSDLQEDAVRYVKENPLKAMGIAAVVGLVLGKFLR